MLRSELESGIAEILGALGESDIWSAIRTVMRQEHVGDVRTTEAMIASFKEYQRYADRYSTAAEQITHIFQIHDLENPAFLAMLISRGGQEPPSRVVDIGSVIEGIRAIQEYLPRISNLISPTIGLELREPQKEETSNYEIIRITLSESKEEFSSPARLVKALSSISDLYEAYSHLEKDTENDLSVIACDSGSNKVFEFLGRKKTIQKVKDILVEVWERVIFFREKQYSARLELVTESLPILKELSEMENNKVLEPESAEIIRQRIISGVTNCLEAGFVTDEIGQQTQFDTQELLAPQPKLLTSITPDAEAGASTDPNHDEGQGLREIWGKLSPEEREKFLDEQGC